MPYAVGKLDEAHLKSPELALSKFSKYDDNVCSFQVDAEYWPNIKLVGEWAEFNSA